MNVNMIVFASVFNLLSTVVYSQISGVFRIENVNEKNYIVQLSINNSNQYILELIQEPLHGSSIEERLLLSLGAVKIADTHVYLIDKSNSFELVLKKNKGILMVIRGLSFMKGRKFIYETKNWDDLFFKIYFEKIIFDDIKKKYTNKKVNLKFGKYYDGHDFVLEITQNGKYKFKYRNFVLSSGKWHKQAQQIKLRDNELDKAFELILVDDDKLESIKLPCMFFAKKFSLSINKKLR